MIKIIFTPSSYIREITPDYQHKWGRGYYATIYVEGREYAEETEVVCSKYQALKLARKIIRECYTLGGKLYTEVLKCNPLK